MENLLPPEEQLASLHLAQAQKAELGQVAPRVRPGHVLLAGLVLVQRQRGRELLHIRLHHGQLLREVNMDGKGQEKREREIFQRSETTRDVRA